MNLEDGTDDPEHPLIDLALAVEKIQAVRVAASTAGIPLVVNARTDVYLLNVGPPESRFSEALGRAIAFRDAGADCIFLPGLKDGHTISRFIKELDFPASALDYAKDSRMMRRLVEGELVCSGEGYLGLCGPILEHVAMARHREATATLQKKAA